MIDQYEYLGHRHCWYCSKDDPSYAGFELREGRIACYDCRQRIDGGQQEVRRTVSAYRAGRSSLSRPAFQLHLDVRDFKDKDRDWLIDRLARALDEAFERLFTEHDLSPGEIVAVPLPGTEPNRDHVARVLASLVETRRAIPTAPELLSVAEREQMHETGADRAAREKLASEDDYQVDGPVPEGPLVLVDDIYVTGNTMNAAARALRSEGAGGPIFGATISRMISPDLGGATAAGGTLRTFTWSYQPIRGGHPVPDDATRVRIRCRFVCPRCTEILTSDSCSLDETGDPATLEMECPACGHNVDVHAQLTRAGITVDVDGLRRNEILLDLVTDAE